MQKSKRHRKKEGEEKGQRQRKGKRCIELLERQEKIVNREVESVCYTEFAYAL